MAILKSEAVVIKTYDLRETSRIGVFFSRDYGKVKGVLKGIRKDPRKFGSSVDRFSVNDIVYYQYAKSDLHLISQCDMRNFYPGLRQDLKKMTAASYGMELIDAIMPDEEPNEDIYRLLLDYLDSLQREDDISRLVHMLQIKILLFSGFRPHLDACVQSGRPITGEARFSMKFGGLVGPDVQVNDAQSVQISKGAVSSILHIEKSDWPQCLRLGLSPKIRSELKYVLNNFLIYHLERQLKSSRFVGA